MTSAIGRAVHRANAIIAFVGVAAVALTNMRADVSTTIPADGIRSYDCRRTHEPIIVDGRPDEAAWANAAWSEPFVDIEGSKRPAPTWRTRFKMLWDDRFLYVYAELEEPHVWGTLTQKNATIYHDNDFEIFLDPTGIGEQYYEFEINALGTIWELTLDRPYRKGGNPTLGTNLPSLWSAVHIDGTVNDPRDVDRAWSVEVAIPVHELAGIKVPAKLPIAVGAPWRMNFSRVQWTYTIVDGKYMKVSKETKPEDNWVWSPQGLIDMHVPERWGVARFVE